MAALLICGSPPTTRCPLAPYLTISSILTPNGAHLSRPVRADGDLRKVAPAVRTRDRRHGGRVQRGNKL